jgi:3-phosphoshikimate 1-carboxyvinyltransferase
LVVPGVEVDDIASTTKTIPDFPGMWATLLGMATERGGL